MGLIQAVQIEGHPVTPFRLSERMTYYRVPGVSIAVIDGGTLAWARAYGVIGAGDNRPVTEKTLFQAGAVGHALTAVTVMRIAEKGLFRLDQPVNQLLVRWKIPENAFTRRTPVTLRHLLGHRAGILPGSCPGYSRHESFPDLVQILDGASPSRSLPLRIAFYPDSRFCFSSTGYSVIQQVLEETGSLPFSRVMDDELLVPLKMRGTTFECPLPDSLALLAARGHDRAGNPLPEGWRNYPQEAASGLWTTPADLSRFLTSLIDVWETSALFPLSRESMEEMIRENGSSYGLGWSVRGKDRSVRISQSGGTQGFLCMMVVYPERGQGAVVMANGDGGWWLILEILRSVALEYGWNDFLPVWKRVDGKRSGEYAAYTGRYVFPSGFTIQVKARGGGIYAVFPGSREERAFPDPAGAFFLRNRNVSLFFDKDTEEEVQALILDIHGEKMRGMKLKENR
jgi:CubicO group peptidase (beta-lactamase class C family)